MVPLDWLDRQARISSSYCDFVYALKVPCLILIYEASSRESSRSQTLEQQQKQQTKGGGKHDPLITVVTAEQPQCQQLAQYKFDDPGQKQ